MREVSVRIFLTFPILFSLFPERKERATNAKNGRY